MGNRELAAGAISTGLIDALIEVPVNHPALAPRFVGKFPYIPTIDPLPNYDDWFVLAIPLAVYAGGRLAKNRTAEDFGKGGLLYAVPMFIHHIILKAARMAPAGYTPRRQGYSYQRKRLI